MKGQIFLETLRRSWRQILYWGIGLGFLGFYVIAIVSDVESLEQMGEMLGAFPPALLQAFGVSNIELLTSGEGFVASVYFSYLLIILAVFAIMAGMSITANEEDEGIMDIMLALPISRAQIMLEKFAAYTLITIGIVSVSYIGLALGPTASELTFNMSALFAGTFSVIPSVLLIIAFTAMVATLVRTRAAAMAIAATFVVSSYFMNFLAEAASETFVAAISGLSFFSYYDSFAILEQGFVWSNLLLMLLISVGLGLVALWGWQRRDVGT